MKKCAFTLMTVLLFSHFSFGQNALFTSVSLLSVETRIDYKISTIQPEVVESGTIRLNANPRFGFAFLKFSEKQNFHQAGLYGLHFHRYEDLLTSQQASTGAQVTDGTKLTSSGGGLLYRYGWKGGRAGKNWLFHVSANAGAFFQSIQKTPKVSTAFPVSARVAGVEGGFRLHVLRKFGDAGFLSLSLPLVFVEMNHTSVKVENPALPASQQRQGVFNQNFESFDRLGIEAGGGFYFQRKG